MMSDHSISTKYWADWFWKRAGGRGGFPADIGYAAMSALEVYVEEVAGLTTGAVDRRTVSIGSATPGSIGERALHGCLLVGRNGAAIFVEKNDGKLEKRFTIAHEVAHFILEIQRFQERAARKLGPDFIDVLQGIREATPAERVDAWLHNVRADTFVHFMDRTPSGGYGCVRIRDAECNADDLAVEILAPRLELTDALSSLGRTGFSESINMAQRIAVQRFGLPATISQWYATRVVWQLKGGPSTAERFGF